MALEPTVKTLLDQVALLGAPPPEEGTPAQARELYKAMAALGAAIVDVASVKSRVFRGPGGPVGVRIYTPHGGTAPKPVLVWFHGGGWVIGDLDTADPTARALAEASGAMVVSVDYRLAPEHRFPAAADDCFAAVAWVLEHADGLGVDRTHVAVGGDSAGANLAAAITLMARDRGGPDLAFQLLVYPALDPGMATPSYRDNGEGYLLRSSTMAWFWDCYLGPDGDRHNPYAAPVHAKDLHGLPPALVITAEYDPLRDEGEAYGAALAANGVRTTVTRYDGEIHGFFGTSEVFGPPAADAMTEAGAALRAALSR